MANEHVVRDGGYTSYDFTVADGTGIEKGAVLKLTDPRTAIITSAAGDKLAGIAAVEKTASDGQTRLSVLRNNAVLEATASGAIAIGQAVISAGAPANTIMAARITDSGAAILGHALETASDAESIQYWLDVGAGGNQLA